MKIPNKIVPNIVSSSTVTITTGTFNTNYYQWLEEWRFERRFSTD
jgi:hypothetical protein